MKRSASHGRAPEAAQPPSVARVIAAAGRPLDADVRAAFEPRFAHSFSDVRIHDDSEARMSARDAGALAYTYGSHIVLGRPATDALLAHELAHAIQQSRAGSSLQRKRDVSEPGDADERDADAAAEAVLAGGQAPPLRAANARMHRQVKEPVVLQTKAFAKACVVHLHGDEADALATAKEMFANHCVNLVFVDNQAEDRYVHIDQPGGVCEVDPNRIFSYDAVTRAHAFNKCPDPTAAIPAIRAWRTQELSRKISLCRRGTGAGLAGPLPVLVLHTNMASGSVTIGNWQPKKPGVKNTGKYVKEVETDAGRLSGLPLDPTTNQPINPQTPDLANAHNLLVATQTRDAIFIGQKHRNVVLQSTKPPDDGSLSVALRAERLVTVERVERPRRTPSTKTSRGLPASPAQATSKPEAEEVITQFGASGTCAPSLTEKLEEMIRDPFDALNAGGDQQLLVMKHVQRKMDEERDLPQPALPDTPPPAVTAPDATGQPRCKIFNSRPEIDAEKNDWASKISAHPDQDAIVFWFIGKKAPPTVGGRKPGETARKQLDCMIEGLTDAANKPASSIVLPKLRGSATHVKSAYRGFATQETKWFDKYNFTFKQPFDRITDAARAKCGPLLLPAHETLWNPKEDRHKFAWGVSTTPPSALTGTVTSANQLDPKEREREILQASSAPGISRHHWGTDFDILDPQMRAEDWERGGAFGDEYGWLRGNAARYGFIQSFTRDSARQGSASAGTAHMEERWHWSYWPIADALLDYAKAHKTEIETKLQAADLAAGRGKWGTAAELDAMRANREQLMFNVNRDPGL